jgi:hypothetical protein
MAKKRVKEKPQVKKSNWWQWIILILLILILAALIIFIVKSGDNGKEKSPCEKLNNSCYEEACPSGYAEVDLGCSKSGQVCCKKIPVVNICEKYGNECYSQSCPSGYGQIDLGCLKSGDVCCKKIVEYPNQTTCEKQNYVCMKSIVPEPGCPNGWLEVGLGCRPGEMCCKEIQQNQTNEIVLSGYVRLKQGNCMPPIGPDCKNDPINTEIALFGRTYQSSMEGNYYKPIIGPITFMNTNVSGIVGYYKFTLEPGEYSFFVKDPLHNNDYYCNNFDSKGNACYLNISRSQTIQIIIDHSTQ